MKPITQKGYCENGLLYEALIKSIVLQPLSMLTKREQIILKFIAKGYTYKQLGEKLIISSETVKKHLQNSYRKLNASNKIEALQKAGMM